MTLHRAGDDIPAAQPDAGKTDGDVDEKDAPPIEPLHENGSVSDAEGTGIGPGRYGCGPSAWFGYGVVERRPRIRQQHGGTDALRDSRAWEAFDAR